MSPHISKTYKVKISPLLYNYQIIQKKKKKTKIYEVIKSHNLPNIMLVGFFEVEKKKNTTPNMLPIQIFLVGNNDILFLKKYKERIWGAYKKF